MISSRKLGELLVERADDELIRARIRTLLHQASALLTEINEPKLSWLVEECADLIRNESKLRFLSRSE